MQQTDGQLLARFLHNRDEHAFEELVRRHSSMIMAACKRVLENAPDAEEAFQNTFLVLIRKAGMHLQADTISGWLYRVAVGTALNMRRLRSIKAKHLITQENMDMMPPPEESPGKVWEAMKGLLDEELDRLADKYRLPLVLCYLEGKNTDAAALDLGLNHNTFRSRLIRGRELLRKRLVRRGITVSAGILNVVLMEEAAKSAEVVSEVLIQSTVKAAMAILPAAAGAAGGILAGLKLMKGTVIAMMYKNAMLVIGGLALLGLFGSVPFLLSGNTHKSKSVQSYPDVASNQSVAPVKAALPEAVKTAKPVTPDSTNIPPFVSLNDYLLCFKRASLLSKPKERWQLWRKLGINLSDEDFDRAEISAKEQYLRTSKYASQRGFESQKVFYHLCFRGDELLYLQAAIFSEWLKKDPVSTVNWAYHLSKLPNRDKITDQIILDNNKTERRPGDFGTTSKMTMGENGKPIGKNGNYEYQKINIMLDAKTMGEIGLPYFQEMTIGKDGQYEYQSKGGGCRTESESFLLDLLTKWAIRDYPAASTWVNNLPDDKKHQSALKAGKAIQAALTNPNPKEALDTCRSIEEECKFMGYRILEAKIIGSKWAETDLKSALAWAN
ncbi:MAG: RNA polymerase sigma factor, partial [Kiritimatiellia bacterium]|nr:RNA polymerase sigma factor [Kiritimatiellia bacterium]